MTRRFFFRLAGTAGGALVASSHQMTSWLAASSDTRNLVRFPEKAELILLTDRPPQLETPLHYFRQDLTPSEAFFVRWHLEGIPPSVHLPPFRPHANPHAPHPSR